MALTPRRGELWWIDPDPVVGRELGRKVRPAVVVSTDDFNTSGLEKIAVVPLTSQSHDFPTRVRFTTHHPQSGSALHRYFCCDDVRAISVERLRGRVTDRLVPTDVLAQVEQTLRLVLGL